MLIFSHLRLSQVALVPVSSFVPASDLASELEALAKAEPLWEVSRSALGDAEGTGQLPISDSKGVYNYLDDGNPVSSDSIDGLNLTRHGNASISTLDRLLANDPALDNCRNLLLKVDTQGNDFRVLTGWTSGPAKGQNDHS